jgi:pentatricopeptide repeat protein
MQGRLTMGRGLPSTIVTLKSFSKVRTFLSITALKYSQLNTLFTAQDKPAHQRPQSLLDALKEAPGVPPVSSAQQDETYQELMSLFENESQNTTALSLSDDSECASLDDIFLPDAILEQIERKKEPAKYLFIFDESLTRNNHIDAYKIFIVLRHKRLIPSGMSTKSFIRLLFKSKNYKKCWEIYDYIQNFLSKKAIVACSLTGEDVIKVKLSLQDMFPTLMSLCATFREAEKALKIYRQMFEQGIPISSAGYYSLLAVLCSRSDFCDEALSVLKQMESDGIFPFFFIRLLTLISYRDYAESFHV